MNRQTNRPSDALHLEEAARWSLRRAELGRSADNDPTYREWLAANLHGAATLERLEETLEDIDHFAGTPEMLKLRRDALVTARRSHDIRRVTTVLSSRAGVAASIVFLTLVLGAVGMWLQLDATTFKTRVGERRVVALADGSKLSLDAATKVRLGYSQDRRHLTLQRGRAKFDVARDPLRPFSVEAGDKVVVATGTSFSVELVGSQVRVVLYEGHVEVLPAGVSKMRPVPAPTKIDLAPGQELVTTAVGRVPVVSTTSASQVIPIDPERSLAWESGDLAFADEPLALAVERVNRYSDAPVRIGDSAAAAVRVSGIFHAGDTRAFIDGVTTLFPVRAEQAGGKTTLVFDDRRNP